MDKETSPERKKRIINEAMQNFRVSYDIAERLYNDLEAGKLEN